MHAHIIHAHPEPGSYNSALMRTAETALAEVSHTVTTSDLYGLGFDPVEKPQHYIRRENPDCFAALAEQRHAWNEGTLPDEVRLEIEKLEKADLVIFQFPLWWHGPPAILKGWMDRVFVSGGLYTSRMRYGTGYFRGKRALLSVTTGAPVHAFGPGSRGGDFDTMLWPLHYSLHYMGFDVLPPYISYGVQGHGYSYEGEDSLRDRLGENLCDWASYVTHAGSLETLHFPDWDDWDENGQALQAG